MGIFKDIKKAFKGSKEYQKRKKGPASSVAEDVKKAAKGSKEYQAARAKRKEARAKRRAASKAKSAARSKSSRARSKKGPVYKSKKDYSKAGGPKPKAAPTFGEAFSSARKAGKKTFSWKGKSYTTKTADDKKKAATKKAATKKAATKKTTPKLAVDVTQHVKNIAKSKKAKGKAPSTHEPYVSVEGSKPSPLVDEAKGPWKASASKYRTKKQLGGMVEPQTAPSIEPPMETIAPQGEGAAPSPTPGQDTAPSPSYNKGGKVEAGNPYGWPSRDARKGGN